MITSWSWTQWIYCKLQLSQDSSYCLVFVCPYYNKKEAAMNASGVQVSYQLRHCVPQSLEYQLYFSSQCIIIQVKDHMSLKKRTGDVMSEDACHTIAGFFHLGPSHSGFGLSFSLWNPGLNTFVQKLEVIVTFYWGSYSQSPDHPFLFYRDCVD